MEEKNERKSEKGGRITERMEEENERKSEKGRRITERMEENPATLDFIH